MFIYIIIIISILFISYLFQNHVHIAWKSFFKEGFSKRDDKFGLYTFCGSQGEGKTFSSVRMSLDLQKSGDYTILTNVESFALTTENCLYIPDILEIIDLVISDTDNDVSNRSKYLILFDEIFTVLMRNAKNMKYLTPITNFLAQLRKRGVIFITTAQVWNEIPIEFRRLCRFQVNCKMPNIPLINRAFTINEVCDGYNCKWDNDAQDFVAPILQTNIAKANKYIINHYDTFETINTSYVIEQRAKAEKSA